LFLEGSGFFCWREDDFLVGGSSQTKPCVLFRFLQPSENSSLDVAFDMLLYMRKKESFPAATANSIEFFKRD